MQQLIIEYLERRSGDFHDIPLHTKHHFILPYPAMMQKFGPLVKMWTMHFKSKHSYFKKSAQDLRISEKHLSASGIY